MARRSFGGLSRPRAGRRGGVLPEAWPDPGRLLGLGGISGEFFGSLGLIVGFLIRLWDAALVIEMIVAMWKVNWWRGYFFRRWV